MIKKRGLPAGIPFAGCLWRGARTCRIRGDVSVLAETPNTHSKCCSPPDLLQCKDTSGLAEGGARRFEIPPADSSLRGPQH